MKFAQENQDEGYVITGYERDSISINGKAFSQSLIITSTKLNENWGVEPYLAKSWKISPDGLTYTF